MTRMPFVAKVLVGLGWIPAVIAVACANGVDDSAESSSPSSAAGGSGGSGVHLSTQEKCGNGIDDNKNGQIDEGCNCTDAGSTQSGEIHTDCTPSTGGGSSGSCVIENAHEEKCSDGRDNDCDGQVDCDDADCRKPGKCGCVASESTCGDAKDDDCDGKVDCEDEDCKGCTPGSVRYCADPNFCALGQQTCGPDRQWGQCSETIALGCYGEGLSPDVVSCCISNGGCCQDPSGYSSGNCAGIDECNQAPK